MNHLTASAIILMASCAILTQAKAQNAYRCGNSYSQAPCPGGVPVDADDSRSKAQKTQADKAIKRDLRTANSMEKSRLQQEEAQRRAAQSPPENPVAKSSATEPTAGKPAHSTKKKSRPPEYFTSRTPGDKKKKKSDAIAPAGTTTGDAGATK